MSDIAAREAEYGAAVPSFGTEILSLVRLAGPLVVSRAGLATMTIVDCWMVARSDAGQLALASLADGTFGRLTDVFAAFILSALPLVGAAAAGPPDARRAFWRRAVLAGLLLGIAGIGLAALALPVLHIMVGDPDLAGGTAAVVWILGLGLPAGLLALASAMYLEGSGRPALVAGWVIAANGLNLALDWLLVGGHGGLPAGGASGSALATTIVRALLAAALVLTLWRIEGARLWRGGASDRAGARAQWRFSASGAANTAGFHALAVWLTVFAGWLGPEALAAFASCWVLGMPALLLAIGTGDAIALRAADRQRSVGQLWRDLSCLTLILAPFGLVLVAAPTGITALYTADPALGPLIAGLLPIGGTVLVVDGLSYGIGAAMRGRGDILGSTMIPLGAMAATPVLAGFLAFGCHMGLRGLLLAVLATSLCRLVLLWRRLRACLTAGVGLGSALVG